LEAQDRLGQTALMLAQQQGYTEVATLLKQFAVRQKELQQQARDKQDEAETLKSRQEQLKAQRPPKTTLKKKQPKP
jgi:hypothetical protein